MNQNEKPCSGDRVQLDSDSEGEGFQDLVIKFSSLRTLLEKGHGALISAHEHDLKHKISRFLFAPLPVLKLAPPPMPYHANGSDTQLLHSVGKHDQAVIVGVSQQDCSSIPAVGASSENDARVMADVCRMHLGMKPSRVKLLTPHTKVRNRSLLCVPFLEVS